MSIFFSLFCDWSILLVRVDNPVRDDLGRFPFRKKAEISVGTKVEFPIGKKLFHLVVNSGTSLCPTVDLELVQTTRNVNGTRDSVRKF